MTATNSIGTIVLVLALLSCQAKSDDRLAGSLTTVEVFQDSIDIGCVHIGDTIKLSYLIKNTGDNPLYIEDVLPSCDCITASYPNAEVIQGDTAAIVLTYEVEGAPGFMYRTAEVVCNSDTLIELTFTGEIDGHYTDSSLH